MIRLKPNERRAAVNVALMRLFARKSKYSAKPTIIDGIRFASKLEAGRWQQLRLLEKAGEIYALSRQVPYELRVRGVVIGRYLADFQYTVGTDEDCRLVVEDTKGMDTSLSRWKRKHLKAQEGIDVQLVRKA